MASYTYGLYTGPHIVHWLRNYVLLGWSLTSLIYLVLIQSWNCCVILMSVTVVILSL